MASYEDPVQPDMEVARMRLARSALALISLIPLAAAAPAGAAVPHTVGAGETLWSIAAASNLTTRTVAAYNGLPETANVMLGATIRIPSTIEGAAALQRAGIALGAPAQPAATAATAQPAATRPVAQPAAASAPQPLGAYVVRPGDTLTGLAAGARVAPAQIAAANGLDPNAWLLAGTVLKLPAGAPAPARSAQPAPTQRIVPTADPAPTPVRVGAADVQQVAAAHGVSPSLAAAIAWQESGFNNAMVSSANARGVMQVMPGTWEYVQANLAQRRLDPASAVDNVHAGVLYLQRLLQESGGDEATAIAGYYQGLGSVRSRGLFDDTQQYVANVQALRSRFGG
jgi:soluble lytic murein transglycosylase-like protein